MPNWAKNTKKQIESMCLPHLNIEVCFLFVSKGYLNDFSTSEYTHPLSP